VDLNAIIGIRKKIENTNVEGTSFGISDSTTTPLLISSTYFHFIDKGQKYTFKVSSI
jgi:hypothetical protein